MYQFCIQMFLCWDTGQLSELMRKARFNSLKTIVKHWRFHVPQKKRNGICDFCIPSLTSKGLPPLSVLRNSDFVKWGSCFSCVVLDHSEGTLGPWIIRRKPQVWSCASYSDSSCAWNLLTNDIGLFVFEFSDTTDGFFWLSNGTVSASPASSQGLFCMD